MDGFSEASEKRFMSQRFYEASLNRTLPSFLATHGDLDRPTQLLGRHFV
jgi:hypothetical protein